MLVSRRVRSVLAGTAVVAVTGGLLLAGAHGGYPANRLRLLSGAAWLVSTQVGQVTLLDGSTAEVAAQVPVAPPGTRLDVVQQGANAYAVNRTAGSVRRVDGGTFTVSQPAIPLPNAGDGLQALAAPGVLYALDTSRGVLTSADPLTLATRTAPVPLATPVTGESAVLDEAGRLWVLDGASGSLVWIDHGQRHIRQGLAGPGGILVLAGSAPVVVDLARHVALTLDPESADTRRTTELDLRSADRVQVSGSPDGERIYLVAARGLLTVCELATPTCATAVPLAGDLGAAVESGRRVFVPDYDAGRVWVVDLDQDRVVAEPRVLDPHTRFQLVSRDGVVFFNDPDSEHAGVIRFDGGVRPVAKYDPKQPTNGPTTQASGPTTPPSGPTAPPPTTSGPGPKVPQQPPTRQPTTSPTPAPTPSPTLSPSPSPPAVTVRIVVSNDAPRTGELISLRAVSDTGPQPIGGLWSFGDGTFSFGVQAENFWNTPGTYLVSIQARFPGGQTAAASITIRVTNMPSVTGRLTVTVNNAGGTGRVTSQPAGISCPPACAFDFAADSSVILTARPGTNSKISGWGGTGCATAGNATTCTVTVPASGTDASVDFGFSSVLRVSVNAGGTVTGGGISCPSTCTFTYDSGLSVNLSARPSTDFVFAGWGGDCAGSGGCSFGMTRDHNVSARFQLRAPAQLLPDDGDVFPPMPTISQALLVWETLTGATEYELEIQPTVGGVASGSPIVTRGSRDRFRYQWTCGAPADGARWRVAGVASDGTVGLRSGWRSFSCR